MAPPGSPARRGLFKAATAAAIAASRGGLQARGAACAWPAAATAGALPLPPPPSDSRGKGDPGDAQEARDAREQEETGPPGGDGGGVPLALLPSPPPTAATPPPGARHRSRRGGRGGQGAGATAALRAGLGCCFRPGSAADEGSCGAAPVFTGSMRPLSMPIARLPPSSSVGKERKCAAHECSTTAPGEGEGWPVADEGGKRARTRACVDGGGGLRARAHRVAWCQRQARQ
jgi:hypothetical protein